MESAGGLTLGSLFAGIGGFDLGFERAGFEIRWQVEIDPFCRQVLEKHWPNVTRYFDVRTLRSPEPVDVICGGFPCQPHSLAGRRGGSADERDLWPEFARIIRAARPRWVVAETCQGFSQVTLDGSLERFSETWPRAGMTRNGIAYRRQPSAPLTDVTESGLWPTPAASLHNLSEDLDGWQARRARVKVEKVNGNGFGMPLTVAARMWPTPRAEFDSGRHRGKPDTLHSAVKTWPTPTSNDTVGAGYQKGKNGARFFTLPGAARASTGQPYDKAASGQLNPTWVEWLMGYPLGWTACEDSGTRSSRRSRSGSQSASKKPKG